MKRKTLTIAISIFALIAIVSVGFASWVITRQDQTKNAEGNITVETIDSGSLILLDSVKVSNNIVFGSPTNSNEAGKWLTSNADVHEQLFATITIITSAKPDDNEKFKVSANATTNADNYNAAVTANYIQSIKIISAESNDYSAAAITEISGSSFKEIVDGDNKGKYEANFKVAFAWGSKFDEKNPYTYYNSKTYSDYASDASTTLQDLYSKLDGVKYTVTVNLPASSQTSN